MVTVMCICYRRDGVSQPLVSMISNQILWQDGRAVKACDSSVAYLRSRVSHHRKMAWVQVPLLSCCWTYFFFTRDHLTVGRERSTLASDIIPGSPVSSSEPASRLISLGVLRTRAYKERPRKHVDVDNYSSNPLTISLTFPLRTDRHPTLLLRRYSS